MPRARLEVGRSAADTSLKQRVAAADDHTMQLSCGKCWLNRCASHTMPPPPVLSRVNLPCAVAAVRTVRTTGVGCPVRGGAGEPKTELPAAT